MIEERFTNVGNDIFQYGELYCSAGGEHCADVIATALNQLLNENKQLKEEVERQRDFKNNAIKQSNWLNEQLNDYLNTEADNVELRKKNEWLNEKVNLLKLELVKTKSYKQLEKEFIQLQKENEQLKSDNHEIKLKNHELKIKYDRQVEELALCYGKLGW